MRKHLLLAVSSAFWFGSASIVACSGSGGAGGVGDPDGGSAAVLPDGSTGTPGTPDAPGSCIHDDAFDFLVPPRSEGDGSFLAYDAHAEGNTIYVSTIQSVFAIDATTGSVTTLYNSPTAIVVHVFVRADDLLVFDKKKLFSVPKTGGTPTELPPFTRTPEFSIVGTLELRLDGNIGYAKEIGVDPEDTSKSIVTYFSHDIASGTETDLGREDRAKFSSFRLGPDGIYSYYPENSADGGPSDTGPTVLFKIPKAGGPPSVLPYSPGSQRVSPMGFQGSDLLLFGTPLPDAPATDIVGRFLRVPAAGGAVTQLGTTRYFLSFRGQDQTIPVPGGQVLRIVDDLFYLADGASTVTKVACISGDYTMHGTTVIGNTIYASVVNGNQGGIVRIPFPH